MKNNNTATRFIELTTEFWNWLWDTDRQSFALIRLGHGELIEEKYKEFEQAQNNKEGEGDNDTIRNP